MSDDDSGRRSVRLTATLRPPDELTGGALADRLIAAIRAAEIGVDVSSIEELGEHDPLGGAAFDDVPLWPGEPGLGR